jgi:outer membrane protein OmpA-like peptidoglycan-associated protein
VLVKDGVPADMLAAKGYGSADPISSNDDPQGRRRNRRIEYHIAKVQ